MASKPHRLNKMSPSKRAKIIADHTEKGVKEDPKIKEVIVHQARQELNDMILVCQGEVEGESVHFHVEKAVLSCVSSPFSNLLTLGKNDRPDEKPKICLEEEACTVETFLNIIYGNYDKISSDSFNHLFTVLGMGDKFCTNVVLDRIVFQLCDLLRNHVENQKPFTTRYGNAVILKFLSISRKIKKGQLLASSLAFNTLKSTILCHWHQYLKMCGAKFLGKCACSCGNCECTAKFCMMNTSFDTGFSRLSVDMFLDEEKTEYFLALDLLLFTNTLKLYLNNGGDSEAALKEFFSPSQ